MAQVARISSANNLTNVELYMDRRFEPAVSPTDLAFLLEVGPILKFNLCINRSYRRSMNVYGVPWIHTTPPTTILNHRAEFPAAHAWPYLNELFSSVATLIPPEFVTRIFAYVVESSANPRAAVIHLEVEVTVVHPVLEQRAVVDSVLIVDEPPLLAEENWDSAMIFDDDDQAEVTPVDIPRGPASDLKERYLISASEGHEDKLGDCAVCLEELKSCSCSRQVLKMPCSHLFHCWCISKWLMTSDTCPLCRAVIP